jgi:hypothetical protein
VAAVPGGVSLADAVGFLKTDGDESATGDMSEGIKALSRLVHVMDFRSSGRRVGVVEPW